MVSGKRIVIIIGAFCVVIAYVLLKFDLIPYAIYPVKSTPHELRIVLYSGYYPNRPIITLGHYINDRHVCDYVLTIENGVGVQEPQKYKLPELREGTVKVNVEIGGIENGNFAITYSHVDELYENGLLIYLTKNDSKYELIEGIEYYDRYIYFVSGKEKTCYFKAAYTTEWIPKADAPSLKRIPERYDGPFYPWDSGWEKNDWVINPIE
jgi:hypothetical protein